MIDPMFDKKRAQKKFRNFVDSSSYAIAKKAAMMVAISMSWSSPRENWRSDSCYGGDRKYTALH